MRVILLAAASTLVMGLGACAPRVDYAHRTALDCPDRQGVLERTSIAADRKTCTYRGPGNAEITLQLTPVNGDAATTLAALETSLVGPAAAASVETEPKAPAPSEAPKPPAPPSGDVARAAQEAAQDAKGSGASEEDWNSDSDRTAVTIGKNHGVIVDGDDHAKVDLPGLHIEAGDHKAKVNVAGVKIDASNGEATVHVVKDVRLRGEPFSRERRGLRATFIAKRDNLPDGYRFVGYQASGPKSGPLTVGVVKSREDLDEGNRLYHDLQRLVRRNGGA